MNGFAKWIAPAAIAACVLTSASTARAAGPGAVTYQGNLIAPGGGVVPDDDYPMTFEFYDSLVGGALRAAESEGGVTVRSGFFSAELDLVSSIFLQVDTLYLELSVDLDTPPDGIQADEVFSPRQRITAAPFSESATQADRALDANALGGLSAAQFIQLGAMEFMTFGDNGTTNTALASTATSSNRGAVSVYDEQGTARGSLLVDDNSAGDLQTLGPNGFLNARAGGFASAPNFGAVEVFDDAGARRGEFAVDSEGKGRVQVFGPNGELNFLGSSTALDNDGAFAIFDDEGDEMASLIVNRGTGGEHGALILRGQAGQASVLATALGQFGKIQLRDSAERTRTILEVSENDTLGGLRLFDSTNSEKIRLTGSGNVSAINVLATTIFADDFIFTTEQPPVLVLDHPTEAGEKVVLSAAQGSESALYQRGKVKLVEGRAVIDLPESFSALAAPGSLTIQLTAISIETAGVGVASIGENQIKIGELAGGQGDYEVHYLIHAARRGGDKRAAVLGALEAVSAARFEEAPAIDSLDSEAVRVR